MIDHGIKGKDSQIDVLIPVGSVCHARFGTYYIPDVVIRPDGSRGDALQFTYRGSGKVVLTSY